MTNSGTHGTPPANPSQQTIEDSAELLAGIIGLADALAAGTVDIEAAREQVMLQQIATTRLYGHARYTDPDDMLIGAVDAVQGAYGEITDPAHMATHLAQIERACAAIEDAFRVLHGK